MHSIWYPSVVSIWYPCGNIWVPYGLPIWKPYGDPGANHIIYQMDPIWQNHTGGIWVSYDFAIYRLVAAGR